MEYAGTKPYRVLGWIIGAIFLCGGGGWFVACGTTGGNQEQAQQETVTTETTTTEEQHESSDEMVVDGQDGGTISEKVDGTESSPTEQTSSGNGFASLVAPIFKEKTCVNDYCHGLSKAGGLDLTEANAYQQLVNQKGSKGVWVRVVPGDPDKSLLYEKLSKKTPAEGSQMPTTGDYLDANQLKRVHDWIKAGATP